MTRLALALAATGVLAAAGADFARGDPRSLGVTLWSAVALALALLAAAPVVPEWALAMAAVAVAAAQWWLALSFAGADVALLAVSVGAAVLLIARSADRPLALGGWALWTPALRLLDVDAAARAAGLGALALLLAAVVARRRGLVGDRALPYAVLGVAAVAALAERHVVVAARVPAVDVALALVAVLALAVLAATGVEARVKDALAVGCALAVLAIVGTALVATKPYETDAAVAPHRAAELLLAGEHPYAAFDMREALFRFGLPDERGTQYEDGSLVRSLNYPAGAFLSVAPFVALGLADVRWVYLAELFLLAFVLFARLPRPAALVAVAALVANGSMLRQFALAGTDPAWLLGVVVAWLLLDRRSLSPVALGLALTARQLAWVVAPFYALVVWRRDGRDEMLRRLAVAAAVFVAVDLPFFVTAPTTFVTSVLAPALAPLEAHGVGIVRLGLGDAPPLPRVAYLAGTVLAFAFALALVARGRGASRLALVLPTVPLFLAWRSLVSYFAPIPLLAAIGGALAEPRASLSEQARPGLDSHGREPGAAEASLAKALEGETPMPVDKDLLEILACPVDKEPVREEGDRLICTRCGRRYPVRDGIPVMLVEEAELP